METTRKNKRLRQLWKALKVNLIGLVETQINPVALQSKTIFPMTYSDQNQTTSFSITIVMRSLVKDNMEEFFHLSVENVST